MPLKKRTEAILSALNQGIIGKEEVLALALLSSIAGESIFLLGAPGVAKSLIARRLKYAFADAQSFEYLMNRFSTPDEIFGPVSISKLKNEDKYERLTARYLPAADIVFLDEIWKASPSIQNALLTVLNEKLYRNGEQEIRLPLKAIIAASNELPAEGEGLEALWDRFLLRYVVEGVRDKKAFRRLIADELDAYTDHIDSALKIRAEEYRIWSKEIDKIQIPEEVFCLVELLREKIEQLNADNEARKDLPEDYRPIYISDRRWRKIVRLLRTSALLNDRSQVDLMDCFLIAHCIWDNPRQWESLRELVAQSIELHGYSFAGGLGELRRDIQALEQEIRRQTEQITPRSRRQPKNYNGYFKVVSSDYLGMFVSESDYKTAEKALENNPRAAFQQTNLPIYWRAGARAEHVGNFQQLRVEIETITENEIKYTPPAAEISQYWDTLLSQWEAERAQAQAYLQSLRQETHLFVPVFLQELAQTCLSQSIQEVERLGKQAQALRHHYTLSVFQA